MATPLILPWPPTINTYYRHTAKGTFIRAKGREYRQRVRLAIYEQWGHALTLPPPYCVRIVANHPDERRRDLDNLLKATLDAVESTGLIDDDSNVWRLSIERGKKVLGGNLHVYIQTYEN